MEDSYIVYVRIGDLFRSSSSTIHSGELVLECYTKDTDMCTKYDQTVLCSICFCEIH